MTNQQDYNGYSNRATWLAALLLTNTSEAVLEEAKILANEREIELLEGLLLDDTEFRSNPGGAISQINWDELTDTLEEL